MTIQKQIAREAFSVQAERYASSPVIAADESRRRFADFVAPGAGDRLLDVATGPGFLALAFAERVAEVVGVDLTPAMLARAEANRIARGFNHVRFEASDAEDLQFDDESFDCTTCGSALHHFEEPRTVLTELCRVTRRGGKVALVDIITSEDPAKAELHNRLERERDPAHVRCLPLSELVQLFEQHGLKEIRTHRYQTPRELDEWFAISHTPAGAAEAVRAAFVASIPDDATGLGVSFDGDRIRFMHTFAWVVGTRSQN